jgi:LysR family nitrogen assimilation transcriptional regulator
MNTRHVETFLRVAQLGSISQAAVAAGLSQPVISRHISDLEATLNTRLLHRDGHGVSLTPAGEGLLPRLRAVLDDAAQARAEAARWSAASLRRVSIALPPTLIRVLAAPLTAAILAEIPDAELRLTDAFSGTLAEWLAEGRIDLAILYASGVSARVQAEPLLTERLHLVMAPGPGVPARIAFDDLSGHRLILPSKAHGLRRTLEAYAAARPGAGLRVQIEADSFAAIVELVSGGFGATILPTACVSGELRAGRLVAVPIGDPRIERSLFLATARNAAVSPGTLTLLRIVRDLMRRLDADLAWSAEP